MLELPDIARVLPHRHPILLVDRVRHLDPDRRIVAEKAISGAEPCYAGIDEHAGPDDHAYPATLLIESFGQAGALLWLHSARLRGLDLPGLPLFGAARDVRFTGSAYPGDVVEHTVELAGTKGDTAFLTGETRVRGTVIVTFGSMLAVARGRPAAPERNLNHRAAAVRRLPRR
ncbi:3-hydroxyacyl-ACP dehydratase FabZ family protein [Actinokineospora diospyrosa]|uniref:3-hydroxyacyl-ACP dehydratase FabZ family protein n=1 Tax=Actinokineospora diospyrosa TaxID=103728 RepID=UPI0020A31E39|nr:beta-hydroxyacyl-ACP dehydratase [Actinokineospora diospyrosa]